jgi:CRP/FNR family cyclic AMP-dependent transcriptional regulator
MTTDTAIVVNDEVMQYFPAGHRFFSTGDHGEVMYVVTAGEVDIVLRGRVLETVTVGSVFGEMAMIDDRERSAEAIAKSNVKVVVIDHARFIYLTRNDPYFALKVMKIITTRLRRLDDML